MKNIFILILLLCTAIKNYSQVQTAKNQKAPSFFSTSPNVASLGTYGLIPINLSTGSPNINIDLLKFSTRGKDYNISLSYSLSSVKPETPVAWTGLGWNLNVGGAVTRSVNGLVDESRGVTRDRQCYYDYFNKFDNDTWYNADQSNGILDIKNDPPDMFLFEVNGINGQFYKNHKGKWIISANQDVSFTVIDEIKEDYFSYNFGSFTYPKDRCIYGFEITDKYGNTYIFGKDPKALETTEPEINSFNSYNEPLPESLTVGKFVKSWYLTKIKYADGPIINFEYDSDNNITAIQHYNISFGFNTCGVGNNNCAASISYERSYLKYLKKITFDEGSVVFNRSLADVLKYSSPLNSSFLDNYNNTLHWYKLNSIVLNDKGNRIVDKVEFSYEENSSSRLKLNTVKIGKDPNNLKKYTFTYNPNKMPANYFNNVDHWGFNNNRNYLPTLPTGGLTKAEADIYFSYREPDGNAVRAETLERVDYPTGGYNIIEYEPNSYSKYVKNENNQLSIIDNNVDKITGGLRVKKISTYSNDNSPPIVKQYYYSRNYFSNQNVSSGVLSGIPNYLYEDHFQNPSPQGATSFDFWHLSSSSYLPLSETNGYHIGYSKVYEKHENGSLTEYSYTNYDNGYIDIINYPSRIRMSTSSIGPAGSTYTYTPRAGENIILNSLSKERGLLLSKKDYDVSNNLVRENIISYNNNQGRLTDAIRSFKVEYLTRTQNFPAIGANIDYIITKYTPYLVYTNSIQKTNEKTINYFNTGKIENNTTYVFKSNFDSSPQKITTNLSDGNIFEQRFLYPQDIRVGGLPPQFREPYRSIVYMLQKNMIGVPLTVSNYKNGKFINRKQTVFDYNPSNGIVYPKLDLNYNEQLDISFSDSDGTIVLPVVNLEDTQIIYDIYDDKGNLQQYTTKDGVSTTVIWGYNGTKPIAKIVGAKLTDITQSLIDTIVNASNTDASLATNSDEAALLLVLDNFRKDSSLSNYQITTYTYDLLVGVRSITSSSGMREIYIYDTANRLKEVRQDSKTGKLVKEFKYNYKS